ncbi:hypothetical protein GCM10009678_70820 [Actinomadura kijaniata]|uniref:Serine/threonine protein kinase n=1 Tax=Actinomadura namibiensis TaxID=182080 RepID=A0A7W3QKK8_ACTNM|nr:serine/threonine-protein kinase [Actinomadura namibiensis]MBA8950517.1 serine/threonine protein kinase [Actinomadura namibiensis]
MDLPTVGEPLGPGDPERVGPHVIRRVLGRGGQGVVYLGESPDHGPVAVKLLSGPGGGVSGEAARRFQREAATAKAVAQFCTARVLDVGTTADGRPYIAGEYVPGPSLLALVDGQGPRSGPSLDRIAVATATALVAIHEAGIVHRDFKPGNVIMGPDGPRVIDFGIARETATATAAGEATDIIGTPAYMAPEQLRGEPLTGAVDVFAWASTMVFVATGRPPFGTDAMTTHRILHAEPDLTGLPSPLRDLVAACLAKDPRARPTAERLLSALITGRAPTLAAPGLPPRPSAAQMMGIGAGLAASSTNQPPAPPPPAPWAHAGAATQPPKQPRSVPLAGVLAGAVVGVAVAVTAGFVLWPDTGVPAANTTMPQASTSPAPPSPSADSARPSPAGSAKARPTRTASPKPSRTATRKPPPKGPWTAPGLPGISARGVYDVSGGQFTSSLSLRMTRKTAGYALFEHQHFDGGTMCDYGVEYTRFGQDHTARFDSRCTKTFRVRTCLARNVTRDAAGALKIDYIRCEPWHDVRG